MRNHWVLKATRADDLYAFGFSMKIIGIFLRYRATVSGIRCLAMERDEITMTPCGIPFFIVMQSSFESSDNVLIGNARKF